MKRSTFVRALLIVVIVSLSISALIGIGIFLAGDFGETEGRILATTSALGFYSLLALCGAALYNRRKYQPIAFLEFVFVTIGFFIALLAIWEAVDIEDIWRPLVIFIILAISTAQISLLLLGSHDKTPVAIALFVTVGLVILLAIMLMILILGEFDVDEAYIKLLGVVGILDVLGTIVTPILRKVVASPKEAE